MPRAPSSAAAAPCRLAAAHLSSLRPPPALVPSASRATVLLVAPFSFASTSRHYLASLHSAALTSRGHLPRNPHLVPHLPRAARAWAQHDVSAPGRHTASRFPGQTTPYRLQSSIFSLTAAEQLPAPPHQSSSSTSADSKLLKTRRPKPPFPVGASLHVLPCYLLWFLF